MENNTELEILSAVSEQLEYLDPDIDFKSIVVKFLNDEELKEFVSLLNQKILWNNQLNKGIKNVLRFRLHHQQSGKLLSLNPNNQDYVQLSYRQGSEDESQQWMYYDGLIISLYKGIRVLMYSKKLNTIIAKPLSTFVPNSSYLWLINNEIFGLIDSSIYTSVKWINNKHEIYLQEEPQNIWSIHVLSLEKDLNVSNREIKKAIILKNQNDSLQQILDQEKNDNITYETIHNGELNPLELRCNQLENEIENIKQSSQEAIDEAISSSSIIINGLKKQIEDIKRQNIYKNTKLSKYTNKLELKESLIQKINLDLENEKNINQKLSIENKELQEELIKYKVENENKNKIIDDLNSSVQSKDSEVELLIHQVNEKYLQLASQLISSSFIKNDKKNIDNISNKENQNEMIIDSTLKENNIFELREYLISEKKLLHQQFEELSNLWEKTKLTSKLNNEQERKLEEHKKQQLPLQEEQNEKLDSLTRRITTLCLELESLEQDKKKLSESLRESQDENNKINEELENLKKTNTLLRNALLDSEKLVEVLSLNTNQDNLLSQTLAELEFERRDLQKEREDIKRTQENLKKEILMFQSECKSHEMEKRSFSIEKKKFYIKESNLRQEIEEEFSKEFEEIKFLHAKNKKQMDIIQEENTKLQNSQNILFEKEKLLIQREKIIFDIESEINSANIQLQNYKEKQANLRNKEAQLKEMENEIYEKEKIFENYVNSYKDFISEMHSKFSSQSKKLHEERNLLQNEWKLIQKENNSIQNQKIFLNEKEKKLQEKEDEFMEKMIEENTQFRNLKQRLEENAIQLEQERQLLSYKDQDKINNLKTIIQEKIIENQNLKNEISLYQEKENASSNSILSARSSKLKKRNISIQTFTSQRDIDIQFQYSAPTVDKSVSIITNTLDKSIETDSENYIKNILINKNKYKEKKKKLKETKNSIKRKLLELLEKEKMMNNYFEEISKMKESLQNKSQNIDNDKTLLDKKSEKIQDLSNLLKEKEEKIREQEYNIIEKEKSFKIDNEFAIFAQENNIKTIEEFKNILQNQFKKENEVNQYIHDRDNLINLQLEKDQYNARLHSIKHLHKLEIEKLKQQISQINKRNIALEKDNSQMHYILGNLNSSANQSPIKGNEF